MPPGIFIRHLISRLRSGGLRWLIEATYNRVRPARPATAPAILAGVKNGVGLEIGGPSRVFEARQMLPVYPLAARIDNVNFSAQTAWETNLRDGGDFRFDPHSPPGTQWIREAGTLTGIADGVYDFVLSSHCLEHVANPLRALQEWHRVTRRGGYLLLILPDPARSFDHRRPITTLSHLRHDLAHHTGEDDATHLREVVALHDLARDPWAGSADEFRERASHNAENRCLHQHVFDLTLIAGALHATGWHVLAVEKVRPVHLVAFAKKAS